jgi:NADPH:quinone reductase-like Zn-dependent oxidoreductase
MTTTMKAMVATGYGSPEVFELQDVAVPAAVNDQILVKVATASVTTADTMMRTGTPYIGRLFTGIAKPKKTIPGTGFSGEVISKGSEVSRFEIGDRVFGETVFEFSSNAEYLVISENSVVLPMPDHMAYEEAASFCDGHLTSYNFLTQLQQVHAGQRVLINGASGSLGTSAIQIAKYLGAHVTAVCSGKNTGLVKSLGADQVINYQEEDFTKTEGAYDVIYDTVGKSSFGQCKKALKEKGVYLSPVLNFSLLGHVLWTAAFGKKKAKFEATGANSVDKLRALLDEVLEVYRSGKLKTVIDRQFPLEKLAEAHRYIDQGHKKGNIIIVNS